MEKSISSSIQKNEMNKAMDLPDKLLEYSSEILEQETNLVLKNVRRDADKHRLQRRIDVDQKIGSFPEIDSEANALDRKAEDDEIVVERFAFDTALDNERAGKRAAHASTKIALTTREEFLAIVSHDLRNPLGTILSCADMLLNDFSFSNIPDEAKRWIEIVNRNAQTSLRLISDILDVERIAEGKLGLQFARHDLAEIINQAAENQAHLASTKSILLKASTVVAFDPINCDGDRVAQILSNLIGNALKFTPEGGTITVSAQDLGSEVIVSVEDTGQGIAADKKDQIFERFAQIGNKDRRGLGLGLFISKILVESHGGKIWVSSSLGHGSVFYFSLPRLEQQSNTSCDGL